jgi:glycosyltransferase involved in cell wall biosynthesis
MTNKLLVIIPDRLSALINKGEVVQCYYNPGNLFSEVHLMMTNDDQPTIEDVQTMVGDAKLYLYNVPPPNHFFRNTLGWQFKLMQPWINGILETVDKIQPTLIRTHNNFLEGYIASKIKEHLSIPYATSLHGVWDVDDLKSLKNKIHRFFRKKMERITLMNADAVICVYSPILKYAKSHGAQHLHLIHNFVGGNAIKSKSSWHLGDPIKLITVNRQLPEKNPENIIKALNLLPYDFEYYVIGDGELHEHLQSIAKTLPPNKRVKFIKSMPNAEVCNLYSQCDFMVSNCHYKGISKTIIEAGLTGLPIILNGYNDGYILKEYEGGWIKGCADTPAGYAAALQDLINDSKAREQLGKNASKITHDQFSPSALEEKVATIYRALKNK